MADLRKIIGLGAFLLLSGLGVFFLLHGGGTPALPGGNPARGARRKPASRPLSPLEGKGDEKTKPPEKTRSLLGGESALQEIPGWKESLGGLKGRVLEKGGAPAPGMEVVVLGDLLPTLLRAADSVLGAGGEDFDPVLTRTRTDREGRFFIASFRAKKSSCGSPIKETPS